MLTDIPYRQIFLEDAISREKTGISPIKHKQSLAKNYYFFNRLYQASMLSLATFAYFAYTKSHSNRRVYLLSLLGNAVLTPLLYSYTHKLKSKYLKEFNCTEDNFEDYAHFYYYFIGDFDNYYEQDTKNH